MSNVSAKFTVSPQKAIDAQFLLNIVKNDHNILNNRDLENQHPISAITGLQEALAEIPTDYVTDSQLETALSTKQDTISDLETIRTNASNGASAYTTIQSYGNIVTHNANEFATAAQGVKADTAVQPSDLTPYATQEYVNAADNGLQGQIDAITAASDVTDIVGTYAELQAYDTTTLPDNSIIKVLQDESRDNETTYYRWVITSGVGSWVLIGEEGPYLTLAAAASTYVPQTRKINNKALSSDISLTAGDVGALPDSTSIPTKTSDLQNDSGFITSSALGDYVTTNTAQTITQSKAFSSTLVVADGVGLATGTILSNKKVLQKTSSGIEIGNSTEDVLLVGKSATTNPKYNGNDLALKSDVPTVNNSTITLTQGGVTKGSFTLNQASGATIDFDAGGGGGSSYTAGTGIDITSNVISVTTPTLTNTATGTNAITVLGNNNGYNGAINIGGGSSTYSWSVAIGLNAKALGSQSTSLGYASSVGANGTNSVAIGANAKTGYANFGIEYAIQLGCGTNEESNSFYVGTSSSNNWKLLGSDGLIPAGRIPISTSVDSTSTNSTVVGAKLFYDTCGDIETLINAL